MLSKVITRKPFKYDTLCPHCFFSACNYASVVGNFAGISKMRRCRSGACWPCMDVFGTVHGGKAGPGIVRKWRQIVPETDRGSTREHA